MRKLQAILLAVFLFVGMSSFTASIVAKGCSCGSPAAGSQVFYSVVDDNCCGKPDLDSKGVEFYYKPTDKPGIYEITAMVSISNIDAMTQCCPIDL
jgi:hypothetical protein